jgi:hypothetical protein
LKRGNLKIKIKLTTWTSINRSQNSSWITWLEDTRKWF